MNKPLLYLSPLDGLPRSAGPRELETVRAWRSPRSGGPRTRSRPPALMEIRHARLDTHELEFVQVPVAPLKYSVLILLTAYRNIINVYIIIHVFYMPSTVFVYS